MTNPDPTRHARAPLPPANLGLRWERLAHDQVPALHDLLHRIEEHDNPPYRTTIEETDERYQVDWHGERENIIGGFDEDGVLAAFGAVSVPEGEASTVRALLDSGVDPRHRRRGIGSAVLDWELSRARGLIAARGGRGRIVVDVEDDMPDWVHMLTERGFRPRRYYTELRRDLSAPLPEVSLNRPLVLQPWTAELDEQVRLAHNSAFDDHWVSEPLSAASWAQSRTYFVPEWSFIALDRTSDRSQVVGYLLSGRYEQDWPSLGWSEGYIDLLGVRSQWRGRGIATALVTRAMQAYAKDQMQYASLGVDTEAPGAVFGLYSKLDFKPTRGSTMYTIEI